MKNKSIYIAGKVSGEDYQECFGKFQTAETMLKDMGFNVINPMRLCDNSMSWSSAMKKCIVNMMRCEAVFLLPDWEDSKGAKIEMQLANDLGIPIIVVQRINNIKYAQTIIA